MNTNFRCPTCQGLTRRETTDMVCMTCGRDYLEDNPGPGLGWKRLMLAWREQCKAAEAELASMTAERDRYRALHYARPGEGDRPAEPHEFEPWNPTWFMPRCKVCREFVDHPIHSGEGDRPAEPDMYESGVRLQRASENPYCMRCGQHLGGPFHETNEHDEAASKTPAQSSLPARVRKSGGGVPASPPCDQPAELGGTEDDSGDGDPPAEVCRCGEGDAHTWGSAKCLSAAARGEGDRPAEPTQELHGSTREPSRRVASHSTADGSAGEADIDPHGDAAHRGDPPKMKIQLHVDPAPHTQLIPVAMPCPRCGWRR